MVAWRRVAGIRFGERARDGRRERDGYMVRGGAFVGVMISRVRTMSRGASAKAAIAVADTATARARSGLGLSIMSRPPIPLAAVPTSPESGMLSSAESRLRVQLSVVLRRKL